MKRKTSILRGLNDIRENYILESEIPQVTYARENQKEKASARELLRQVTSSGWFAAAVCAVVALGTLGGIIMAGQHAADPSLPPVISQPNAPVSVLHRETYYKDGEELSHIDYIYDEYGTLIQIIDYSAGSAQSSITYTYNEDDLLIQKEYRTLLMTEHDVVRTTYEYDEEDRLIEESVYDRQGNLQSELFYSYDEKGRLIKLWDGERTTTRVYGEHDSYVETTVYHSDQVQIPDDVIEVIYDARGNMIKHRQIFSDMIFETVYEYNEADQETKISAYKDGVLLEYSVFEYKEGLLTTLTHYVEGQLSGITTYEYNEHGDCLKEEIKDAEGISQSVVIREWGPLPESD